MPAQKWDAALYQEKHNFVWQYGESLIELLSPQSGDRLLDLGCGTGQLSQQMAAAGAEVIGIDTDATMIQQAQQNYPELQFEVADARNFQVTQPYDAVFSNAVLHWIPDPEPVIDCVWRSLKPGGRFVAEFGGRGNVQGIVEALYETLREMGCSSPRDLNPWYFHSLGEYATLLEHRGFRVTYAVLFDRPTPLTGGAAGMANWLRMFANKFFAELSAQAQTEVIRSVEARLKPTLYQDGGWIADYRRLRLSAIKD